MRAVAHDAALVNAWGLAASPTGPWWTANEARGRSTLYAADGQKQSLTVVVDGGPTGIVYNGGRGFVVRGGGASAPARFIYACEDGMLRGWAPSVPHGWSRTAEVAVDEAAAGAVFRGVAIATLPGGTQQLYATDFHNARVDVYDAGWQRIFRRGAFVDRAIPSWHAPFGYVDEFDLDGRLVAHVGQMGPLNEPWGLALAPRGVSRLGGQLLVGNFGSGRIDVYARHADGWSFSGQLLRRNGSPVRITGLWGIAFGNGGMAGPSDALFFAAGPHRWHGASELAVHGLFGSIVPAR
jgi:hypothetical protein